MRPTSKTTELRKQLKSILKLSVENVYYGEAPDSRRYPYVVYELGELGFSDGRTLFQMEVNVFDYGESSSAIETISDNLQEELDQYYFINEHIQFNAYRNSRQIVRESDKKIMRRRLLFEIHFHERKGV